MRKSLQWFFTFTRWLPTYSWTDLRGDLVAGLTSGVVLIPQAMAYAILAGLPAIYGLYASVVPLFIYPIFGTSRHLAIGTVAIDMVIVAMGIGILAEVGTQGYLMFVFLLTFMVGALQLIMGFSRLGFVVNLLSRPVIVGFMSAAALIIGFSQLGNLLGVALPKSPFVALVLWEGIKHINDIVLPSLALGIGGIVTLLVLKKWWRIIPGPLVVVILGTLLTWWFGIDQQGIEIVGSVPEGLPSIQTVQFDLVAMSQLLPTAVTLALIQFMTIISLGSMVALRRRYDIKPNRELVAIGASNLVGSFFQCLPVSGSISRTAIQDQAGGRTPMANVVTGTLVGLTLLFLTSLFYYLPIPVLASIIIVAVFSMIDLQEIRYLLQAKRIDGGLAILTFSATLFIGIQEGILIGIAASVIAILYRISRPNVSLLGHLPGTRSFGDLNRHDAAKAIDGLLMIRVDASFSFANSTWLKEFMLKRSKEGSGIKGILIDASSMNDLDMTALEMLKAVADTLSDRGVGLYFSGVKGNVRDVMIVSGLYDQIGEKHFFLSPHRAVKHVLSRWGGLEDYLSTIPGEPGGGMNEPDQ